MKKYVKYPLIIIGVLLGLVFALFLGLKIYWTLNGADEPAPDDSDLMPEIKKVPDGDNAYLDLIKIKINMPERGWEIFNKYKERTLWDQAYVENLISKNKENFENFYRAANKTKFQYPPLADQKNYTSSLNLVSINSFKQFSEIVSIEAIYLAKQGKEREALDEINKLLSIAQKIQDSGNTLITNLISVAVKKVGINSVREITLSNKSRLSSDDLIQNIKKLDIYKENEHGLVSTWKSEYLMQKNSINIIIKEIKNPVGSVKNFKKVLSIEDLIGKFNSSFAFKPNETQKLFANNTRIHIENTKKFCNEIIPGNKIDKNYAATDLKNLIFTENYFGKKLASIYIVSLFSVIDKKCSEDANIIETQLLLALKAYEQDNSGKKASKLSDLVPKYLSEVPVDPFSGQPVKYSPEGGVKINKERIN